MGNCISTDTETPQEWSYLNRNFSEISFRKEVNHDQFLAYQRFLDHIWAKFSFDQGNSTSREFNDSIRHKLKQCVVR